MNNLKPWENGILQLSENNRYLKNGKKPFFWMGDTAWLLLRKLDLEETYIYLKNRKEKGFNMILIDLLHSIDQKNVYGDYALVDGDFTNPCITDGYWEHVDKVVKMAEDMGLYMGILPVWASSVVKSGFLNMGNYEPFFRFIANRYKDYPNIIWLVGGDIRGDVNVPLFNEMGKLLKKSNPDRLVGFHPFGRTSSSLWFHEQEWLDFNMFQSGHRRYDQVKLSSWDDNITSEGIFGEDNWKYVQRDLSKTPIKPTVDGEPSYEHILQGLHDETQPYWQVSDVRRYAYWSVFEGACGHTYGDNSVMQFFKKSEKKGAFGVKDTWEIGIDHPGSFQMKHLYDLMNSIDFIHGNAAEELLAGKQKEKYDRVSIFAGEDYILCYNYSGIPFQLNIAKYKGELKKVYWFDPETGEYTFNQYIKDKDTLNIVPPPGKENKDYVVKIK